MRDTHEVVREKGDACLASQMSQISPRNHWHDQCSQPDLPHIHVVRIPFAFKVCPRNINICSSKMILLVQCYLFFHFYVVIYLSFEAATRD